MMIEGAATVIPNRDTNGSRMSLRSLQLLIKWGKMMKYPPQMWCQYGFGRQSDFDVGQ
jgi:hypothetical protein